MINYIQEIKDALRVFHPNMKEELLDVYALLVLVKGVNVTLEDVHDAWSVWKNQHRPDHWSLIPFEELKPEVQGLDQKYVDTIRIVSTIYRQASEDRKRLDSSHPTGYTG
jgi:hypothetical protein